MKFDILSVFILLYCTALCNVNGFPYDFSYNARNWALATPVMSPFPMSPVNSRAPTWSFLYNNYVNDERYINV
ncbi:unnamed protein product [Bursaphelenchus okinawaensis]|uniref:Uncharacterized protein n=1 Tax=Bursaphelenchus okinawaensis TaxID=465554 RepID=A0A811K0N4_9BILA|nr:unnamed protein product [Bursaphelenchus okinawaensis]CAG9088719.1 unnamed protein product [Bursaphelenchus okinawaensis]